MSEVNQAFLRAYLKNRTQNPATTAASQVEAKVAGPSTQTQAMPARAQHEARATPTLPSLVRPRVPQPEPLLRQAEQGRSLRVDPSHAPENSAPALPARQGVWSPLGVERGMKAMERMSVPAVVSNGVVPVTQDASRQRRAVQTNLPHPVTKDSPAKPQPTNTSSTSSALNTPVVPITSYSPNITTSSSATNSRNPSNSTGDVHYDQVMFVDGLSGSPSPPHLPARQQPHTLEEITEPIAIGAGATFPNPSSKRTGGLPLSARNQSSTVSPNTIPEQPTSTNEESKRSEVFVNRRFDAPHVDRSAVVARESQRQVAATPPLPTPVSDSYTNANKSNTSQAAKSVESLPLPLPVAFTPSWEVDTFYWPEVVKQIEKSHSDAFHQIGKHLSLANRDGLRVMAITSGERGVGRSTVAMHMARCAAAHGLKVALVDGDTYCPSLIDQLRLDIQHGWQDCLFENVPLSEVAVHSIADRITLFPLTSVVPPQQMHANLHRMAKMIKRISTAFDMVFIDASRLNLEQRDLVGVAQESIVDAAIVVVDTELSIKEKVDSAVSILQGMGISSVGLVENFQS